MKTIKIFPTSLCLAIMLTNFIMLRAQDFGESIKFKDSINVRLSKFGMELLAYPSQQELVQCERIGRPVIQFPIRTIPDTNLTQPVFISDTGVVYGKTDDFRNVYWLHGLNGTINSWRAAAEASEFGINNNTDASFPARKINSKRGDGRADNQFYQEDGGITSAARSLNTWIDDHPFQRTSHDFIIGHSQGGIVGREWLRRMDLQPGSYTPVAHGIVTFGTPHGGAQILNNSRPFLNYKENFGNKVPAFMDEACKSIGDGLVAQRIKPNFLTRLIPSYYMDSLVKRACNFLSESIIPIVIDNYHKPTTNDFFKGAPFLDGGFDGNIQHDGLNNYASKVPVVQFYGEEEQPVLWRFMSSTLDAGEVDKATPNSARYFAFTKDDQLIPKVNGMINGFMADYEHERNRENINERNKNRAKLLALIPGAKVAAAVLYFTYQNREIEARRRKDIFERAKNWLTNANDYYLADLVGVRANITTLQCYIGGYDIFWTDDRSVTRNTWFEYVEYPQNKQCSYSAGQQLLPPIRVTDLQLGVTGNSYRYIRDVIPTWTTTAVIKPSDGVVLVESQIHPIKMAPGVVRPRIVRMDGWNNHDQMKNCEATKTALYKLYEGDYGTFFQTDKQ